jgi:AraC-like DNA-binding protein
VEIGAGDTDRFFCVQIPVKGSAEIMSGPDRIVSTPGKASVPTPTELLRMRWEPDAAHLIIKVEQPLVYRYLRGLLGRVPTKPIRPLLGMRLATALHGQRWRAINELLLAELDQPDTGLGRDARVAALQDLVVSSLLVGHPNNYTEELDRPAWFAGPAYVRRAMDYAAEHLGGALSVGDLAQAADVSVRSLQSGFQRAVGSSPTSWVRERRLERARAELVTAEPGDGTLVTDIALRWGFSHFGRFAQLYAQRFGECPSETLRRAGQAAG